MKYLEGGKSKLIILVGYPTVAVNRLCSFTTGELTEILPTRGAFH